MRIIFFGTPEFAIPSLGILLKSGFQVPLVVSQPDRPKGRGRILTPPPVKEFAASKGITVMQPAGVRDPFFHEQLRAYQPDAIVVVAYGKIMPPDILKIPAFGCINVHASLLPKYRGAAPIQWAIINGETATGVTTMLMDEGLDTGDILLQEGTEIGVNDMHQSLGVRLSEMGALLLIKTLNGLLDRTVLPIPQRGQASYAPALKKEDGLIVWSKTAVQVWNLIRGTWPWPGAYCYLGGERITIIHAAVSDTDFSGDPGSIVSRAGGGLEVATGKGILRILEVKPEGKKNMSSAAFIQGRHLKEGMRFETS